MKMGKVLVFGTGLVSLATVKEYAKAGLEVVHLTTKRDDNAGYSKYVRERVVVPSPLKDSEKLLRFLTEGPKEWDGALLVPTNDPHVVFLAQNSDLLEKKYEVAVQPWSTLERVVDKRKLYAHAHEIGIPAPKVLFPESIEDLRRSLLNNPIRFPCILKPYQTPEFFQVYKAKVLISHNSNELIGQFLDVQEHGLKVMVSEIIPGPSSELFIYVSHIDRYGNPAVEMCVRKIRQHPADFGVGSAVKTVPMNDELRNLSIELLRSLGYRGFSAAEFKFDRRENRFKLIEINPRSVLYQQLFTKAGINFSLVMYMDRIEKKRALPQMYAPDVYWIHNFFDMIEFRKNQRSREIPIDEFLRPYGIRSVFAVPFLDDPVPFFKMWAHTIKGIYARKRALVT